MSDTSIYNLARRASEILHTTAWCQEPDLRRVVGHANMLDGLIAKLVDLGYEWNDDESSEQTTTVTDRRSTASGPEQSADHAINDATTESVRHSDDIEPSGDFYDSAGSGVSDQIDYSRDSDSLDNVDDGDDSDTSSESDESEQSDFDDSSDAASVEMFEEYGNRNTSYCKYILIWKAQKCRASSPDTSVLVGVQEIE